MPRGGRRGREAAGEPRRPRQLDLPRRGSRALLAALDGSCRTPVAGLAVLDGDALSIEGLVAMPDGSALHRLVRAGRASEGRALGAALGGALRELAPPELFAAG